MARARNIKPSIFKNEVLGVADPLYTLLFEGLWVLADRAGRLEDRPMRIKAEVFPYRDGLDTSAMLNWLQQNGFILRYRVAGVAYIQIVNFEKHQNPHKNEAESEIPAPTSTETEEVGSTSEKIGTTRADSLSSDSLIPDYSAPDADAPPPSPAAKRPRFDPLAAELPEWLPSEQWARWVSHRAAIGKRIKTADTVDGCFKAIDKLRAEGFSVDAVLDHNIAAGNQGIYPPPRVRHIAPTPQPNTTAPSSDADRTRQLLEAQRMTPEEKAKADAARKAALAAFKPITKEAA